MVRVHSYDYAGTIPAYTLSLGTARTGLTASQYTVTGLTVGTVYYWTVEAVGGCPPNATTTAASCCSICTGLVTHGEDGSVRP